MDLPFGPQPATTAGGLLRPTLDPNEYRKLLYVPEEHLLAVISGYNDKDTKWPWFLRFYGDAVFYTNNWPRGMKAVYTTDGTDWLPVDISQVGPMELATARFSPPMMVRTIRFELTQSHSPEWWSICELYVFSPTG